MVTSSLPLGCSNWAVEAWPGLCAQAWSSLWPAVFTSQLTPVLGHAGSEVPAALPACPCGLGGEPAPLGWWGTVVAAPSLGTSSAPESAGPRALCPSQEAPDLPLDSVSPSMGGLALSLSPLCSRLRMGSVWHRETLQPPCVLHSEWPRGLRPHPWSRLPPRTKQSCPPPGQVSAGATPDRRGPQPAWALALNCAVRPREQATGL